MTIPTAPIPESIVSTPSLPKLSAAIIPLALPGGVYVIRPEEGASEILVTTYDLSNASTAGNPVSPIWSDAQAVIDAYGLNEILADCRKLALEMFGPVATVAPSVESDPDSTSPSLVFSIHIPPGARHLRHEFVIRYSREMIVPEGAPVPVLLWVYLDGLST